MILDKHSDFLVKSGMLDSWSNHSHLHLWTCPSFLWLYSKAIKVFNKNSKASQDWNGIQFQICHTVTPAGLWGGPHGKNWGLLPVASEWAIWEVDPLVPIMTFNDCIPSQHYDCTLLWDHWAETIQQSCSWISDSQKLWGNSICCYFLRCLI